jgi:replicative DNA helicase
MSHVTGSTLFDAWHGEVISETPPLAWSCSDPVFAPFEIGPNRIILLGGAPGSGKTALLCQWVFGLLADNPNLRVLVGNVEMPPHALLTRQLSRLSGVPLTTIHKRRLKPADRLALGLVFEGMRPLIDRLAFATNPHSLGSIATAASDFEADLLVVDYLQRITPVARSSGAREQVNALMSELRQLADLGQVGVLAAAALSRSRDSKGNNSYRATGLASFRESSEAEYGSDDCLILAPTDDNHGNLSRPMLLTHVKSRYGEQRNAALTFHRQFQRFEIDPFVAMATKAVTATKATGGGTSHDWNMPRKP